jgi:hypothetical protein
MPSCRRATDSGIGLVYAFLALAAYFAEILAFARLRPCFLAGPCFSREQISWAICGRGALSSVDVRGRRRKLRQWGDERMNDRLSATQRELRRLVYISCWHENSGECLAMWKLYPDKGIAVQTTVAKLKAALAGCAEQTIYIGKVEYLDYSKTGSLGLHELSPFVHKRRSFAFEPRPLLRPAYQPGLHGVPMDILYPCVVLLTPPRCAEHDQRSGAATASPFRAGNG